MIICLLWWDMLFIRTYLCIGVHCLSWICRFRWFWFLFYLGIINHVCYSNSLQITYLDLNFMIYFKSFMKVISLKSFSLVLWITKIYKIIHSHTSFFTPLSCTDSGFGDSVLWPCLGVGFNEVLLGDFSGSIGFCLGSAFFSFIWAGSGSALAGSVFLDPAFPQVLAGCAGCCFAGSGCFAVGLGKVHNV